ncbi:MAG: DUF3306 domain-containing protein [Burkholderiales bacterium]
MTDDEPFLSRWSRRKVEAREQPIAEPDLAPEIHPQPPADLVPTRASGNTDSGGRAEDAATKLPSLDSLRGLESEYREFLKPDVDAGTRRAALKKLFSDPHFNQMDGLDVYIDDYGKFEPMTAAVSASLAANKYLRVVNHLLSEEQVKKADLQTDDSLESGAAAAAIEPIQESMPSAKTIEPIPPIEISEDRTSDPAATEREGVSSSPAA